MSKKYLLVLILIIFVSIGVVSAQDNSTDQVKLCLDNSTETLSTVDEPTLSSNDYDNYYGDEYYSKAVLKPKKMTTTYNSGETFNVKAVSSYDKSFTLDGIKLKLRVYTKNSHKDYYAYTDYDGLAEFKVSKSDLGNHKVVVSSANAHTKAKKVTSSFKITKAKTKVYAPKVTTKYKKSKKFKIKIINTATRKPVKKVKISVKVGNKKFTLKTNSKGVASFKTKSFSPGKYKVIIKSKNNSKYKIHGKSKLVIKEVHKKKKVKRHSSSSSYSDGGSYVANANTGKFHYAYCSFVKRMNESNKIYLTYQQAINQGYSPCKICRP